jgi:amino acid transporter
MTYAFARDGGLPGSRWLGQVNAATGSPSAAIWGAAALAAGFTILVPYTAIAAVCAVFLYVSYVLPVAAGLFALDRTWTRLGPWQLGRWFRPLAAMAVLGCLLLIVVGMCPPNTQALWILGGALVLLACLWLGYEQWHFRGPPATKS